MPRQPKTTAAPASKVPAPAGAYYIPDDAIVRVKQLLGAPSAVPPVPALVPVARSTLYAWMTAGTFPRPTFRSGSVMGWRMADVREWLAKQRSA